MNKHLVRNYRQLRKEGFSRDLARTIIFKTITKISQLQPLPANPFKHIQ